MIIEQKYVSYLLPSLLLFRIPSNGVSFLHEDYCAQCVMHRWFNIDYPLC